MREGSDRGEMEDEALRESEAERGRETGEKNKAGQGNQTVRSYSCRLTSRKRRTAD